MTVIIGLQIIDCIDIATLKGVVWLVDWLQNWIGNQLYVAFIIYKYEILPTYSAIVNQLIKSI